MWYRLERCADDVLSMVDRMDSQQWIVMSIIAVGLGAIFLRGFGSRTTY